MLEELRKKVYKTNLELYAKGVVIYTWGNVSERDRETNYIVIKPSGIKYEEMTPKDMVILDLDGNVIEGDRKPSSDTPTHLYLYKRYNQIGGICHTHSTNATAFAQAGINIPALGTTHADYFYGDIPCTRELFKEEVVSNYELNTGKVIAETIDMHNILKVPGVFVKSHGVFTWGKDSTEAVYNAIVLERVSEIAIKTLDINNKSYLPSYVLDKHYYRKHGKNAYYGQNWER